MTQGTTISYSNIFLYGLIAMPLAFAGLPLYIYAPDFYATEYGVSLAAMGGILLLLRLFDAVQDPFIGYISDHYPQKRPYVVLFSSILLSLSFLALFQVPSFMPALVWFTLFVLLSTTAFSAMTINLNALGAIWSRNSHDKTRITSMREGLGLIGLLLAVILPAVLMQYFGKSNAFLIVAAILAVLVLVAAPLFYYWSKRNQRDFDDVQKKAYHVWDVVRDIPTNTAIFYFIYVISMLASAIPAILVLFFIRDRLDAESYTGLFLAIYFISGVLAMPLWQRVSLYYNKYRAWNGAMMVAVVGFFWAYFLGAGDVWQFAVICLASGIAFGADLSLPPAILADHVQTYRQKHRASAIFGQLTFLLKLAIALASVIALPWLEHLGYQPDEENDALALSALSLFYAAIPCVIKAIAMLMLAHYADRLNITEEGNNDEKATFFASNISKS